MTEQKNILVVGGSSGIGKATLEGLRKEEYQLFNVSRSASGVSGVKDIILDVTSDFQSIDGLPDILHGLVYCPAYYHQAISKFET